jgi:anti-sigma B factor antagonist
MKLTKHMRGDVTVITLDGSLDSGTASSVEADLERMVPEGGMTVLDLSKMSYMSSAGLRVLLLVQRRAQASGARVALAGLPEDVREVMAATGFLDFFAVCDTVEQGAEALA